LRSTLPQGKLGFFLRDAHHEYVDWPAPLRCAWRPRPQRFIEPNQRSDRHHRDQRLNETRRPVAVWRLASAQVCAYLLNYGHREVEVLPLPSSMSQPVFLAILGLGSTGHPGADTAPALQIAGKARESVAPAAFYAFTPTVIPHSDHPLKFTIQNKPAWASFGRRRGTLYGTPNVAHAGTYANIRITVSDGKSSVTLPAFSITVAAPSVAATSFGRDPVARAESEASKTEFLQLQP
jgi:hypothetical protein